MSVADANGYLALAERTHRNLRLLAEAAKPGEPRETARDWLLTMHFYVVVAYVNALAAAEDRRSFHSHDARRAWVRSHVGLRPVATDYLALDGWSRDARYDGVVPTDLDEAHTAYARVVAKATALLRAAGMTSVPNLPPVDFE